MNSNTALTQDPQGAIPRGMSTIPPKQSSPPLLANHQPPVDRRHSLAYRERMIAKLLDTLRNKNELYSTVEEPLREDYLDACRLHALYGLCDVADSCNCNPFLSMKARLNAKYHLMKAKSKLKHASDVELKRHELQDKVQALEHPVPNETLIEEAKMALARFEAKQKAKRDARTMR